MIESQLEKWALALAGRSLPLALELPSGQRIELGPEVKVVIKLKSNSSLRYMLDPTLGNLGTAYVEGKIDIDGDVEDVLEVAAGLAQTAGGVEFKEPSTGLLTRILAHSRRRDKDAIQYHYDLSNEFYQLFLDAQMVYSCGYFRDPKNSLDQAQQDKIDHILRKLCIKPGERLLDVGCGWGALMIHAAERGMEVVGVTLSERQTELARARIAERGLSDRCEVRLMDYRDIPDSEQFDKIVSVGMFEHVGHKNLALYFEKLNGLLRQGGAMLMHGITSVHPDLREIGGGGGDFIDRYVFPDGELPHVSFVLRQMAGVGLEVVDVESLRRHYALTLSHWARRLDAHADAARALVGEKRWRIWRVYLAGCGYGFAQNWMNIYQMLACKPGDGSANPFPMTRDWIYPRD